MRLESNLKKLCVLTALLVPLLAVSPAAAVVIHVTADGSADPATCGDTWAVACALQTALDKAVSGDEIWAAAGTYTPTSRTEATKPRSATFSLKSGVAIYGGFAGTESALSERVLSAATTSTLSGDIDTTAGLSDGDAFHVVTGSGTDATAVLDGFTISGGYAYEYSYMTTADGAGMYVSAGSPTLANLVLTGNAAESEGGGLYVSAGNPALSQVTFTGNSAVRHGGGLCVFIGSPTLNDVAFTGNTAGGHGAGMYVEGGTSTVADVLFSGNSAAAEGGGLYVQDVWQGEVANVTLTDVAFTGNYADWGGGGLSANCNSWAMERVTFEGNSTGSGSYGGGAYVWAGTSGAMTDVVFTGNASATGGGLSVDGSGGGATPSLTGVVFTGNSASEYGGGMEAEGRVTLTDGFFQGNSAGYGGGGMVSWSGTGDSQTLTNVVFSGNYTTDPLSEGGAIAIQADGSLAVVNGTFSANHAPSHGGAIVVWSAAPTMTNAVLWGNTAGEGPEAYVWPSYGLTLSHSLVQGGCDAIAGATCAGGNADADPLFVRSPSPGPDGTWGGVDDDYGDLSLQSSSPAVNLGDDAALLAGVTTDLADQPRIYGGTVDLGAYELQSASPAAIALLPADRTVAADTSVSFEALAGGNPTPTVQWQELIPGGTWSNLTDGAMVTGATSTTLTLVSVPLSMDGYQYRAVFNNGGSDVVSNAATLSVVTAPTVTSVSASDPNGAYKANEIVHVTVTFSLPVTVDTTGGTPTLTLATGSVGGTAVGYTSGSGTDTLTFAYLVTAGDTSADLDYVSTSSLALNGGTIRYGAADAFLTLPAPGAADSLGYNKDLVIDTTAPQTTILTGPADPSNSASASFTFEGSDGTGSGLAGFQCSLDGSVFTTCTSPHALAGFAEGSHTFQVRSRDVAGNVDASPASHTWTIDLTAPAVIIDQAAGQSDPTATAPIHFTVVFSEPVTGFVTGDVALSGAPGTLIGTVSEVAPNDGTTYDVAVSGMTGDGPVKASLPAGAAQDPAGNPSLASTSTDNQVGYIYLLAPIVTLHPGSATVESGLAATLTAAASGSPAPAAQWQVSGDGGTTWSDLRNATDATYDSGTGLTSTTYSFTARKKDNGKLYRAVFSNAAGSAASHGAMLTVTTTQTTTYNTTTDLSGAPNPAQSTDPVTLTATVTGGDVPPGSPDPTGTVSFLEERTVLGTCALSGGTCQLVLPAGTLGDGVHAITAEYGRDSSHAASTSAVWYQAVGGQADVSIDEFGVYDALDGTIRWTLTVTNLGEVVAENVEVTDTLDKGTNVVQVTPPAGKSYTTRGRTVIVNLGTLDHGASATVELITIEAELRKTPTEPTAVENTATVETTSPDADPTNDSATAVVVVEPPTSG